MMECGISWAVEARREGKVTEREQTAEQVEGKKVRFREEEQSEEAREHRTDEQDVTSGCEEVGTDMWQR